MWYYFFLMIIFWTIVEFIRAFNNRPYRAPKPKPKSMSRKESIKLLLFLVGILGIPMIVTKMSLWLQPPL
jgi:hypothetical protein